LQAIATEAADGLDLSMKSKAMATNVAPSAEPVPTRSGSTLFPDALLAQASRDESRAVPRTCRGNLRDLCYDGVEGRIVYRGAAPYMPRVEGLTAESVSLRHNGLALRYSFR
jgi:hypothetical protein